MSTLQDRLGSFPEPWKPDPGDKLIGELVDLDMRQSDYGDPYPILTILDDEGCEWAWHAFHTMARNEIAKKKPQIGERIGVAYHGKGKATPGMNPPERWRVLIEGRVAQHVDWDAITPDDDAQGDGDRETADDEIPY